MWHAGCLERESPKTTQFPKWKGAVKNYYDKNDNDQENAPECTIFIENFSLFSDDGLSITTPTGEGTLLPLDYPLQLLYQLIQRSMVDRHDCWAVERLAAADNAAGHRQTHKTDETAQLRHLER